MNVEIAVSFASLFIALLALAVSFWYNKKTLEQSEKNTVAQITYEGKKNSLWKLMKIIKENQNDYELEKKLDEFLQSPDAVLLPSSVIGEVYKQKSGINKFNEKNSPYPQPSEPSEEEIEKHQQEEYEYYERLSDEEKFEERFSREVYSAKSNIIGAISRELNFPIPKKEKLKQKHRVNNK